MITKALENYKTFSLRLQKYRGKVWRKRSFESSLSVPLPLLKEQQGTVVLVTLKRESSVFMESLKGRVIWVGWGEKNPIERSIALQTI